MTQRHLDNGASNGTATPHLDEDSLVPPINHDLSHLGSQILIPIIPKERAPNEVSLNGHNDVRIISFLCWYQVRSRNKPQGTQIYECSIT